jgi:transcriptional regulator with XRE-family HTH domain
MSLPISDRIRKILRHYNLTQKALCLKCDLEQNTLSNAKRGKNTPNIMILEKIHIAFPEIKVEWLFCGEGKMLEPVINTEEVEEEVITIEFLTKKVEYLEQKIKDQEEIITLMKLNV